jgi:RimJ/RimL family protein N-acetyltransferase
MTHTMNAHEFSSVATLVDGSEVTLRSLRAEDYDAVMALAADLSAEERYLRFFTAYPAYIGEWALSVTRPADGFVALGVFENGELIGVANYATSSEPGCAEIAVVVAHEQHERGVGTALLQALGRIARDAGQHRFVADVLCENNAIRRVISDAGWPVTRHRDGSVLSVEVDLDAIDDGRSATD